MKFINFLLFLWVIFLSWIRIWIANPDPDTDPGTLLNPDLIRINNTGTHILNLWLSPFRLTRLSYFWLAIHTIHLVDIFMTSVSTRIFCK
jgi:hypothetical protein